MLQLVPKFSQTPVIVLSHVCEGLTRLVRNLFHEHALEIDEANDLPLLFRQRFQDFANDPGTFAQY